MIHSFFLRTLGVFLWVVNPIVLARAKADAWLESLDKPANEEKVGNVWVSFMVACGMVIMMVAAIVSYSKYH